ncbi:hypothetical protein Cni_G29464 [Canna indica]|uniref:Retrotransposon gag domain-containing protein n=1 Tax=Canna indica TaxID=4628 RepID=A0AAQ3L5A9_9LILI|nr:hypothetical protein Cni_G29464 [Canna indica]
MSPLREYIYQFQAIAAEIPNLDPRVEFFSINFGVKLRHFADQIFLMKRKGMSKFQEKAANFIEMEELREAKKANMQNLKAAVEDRKSKRVDRKNEDRNLYEQNNGRGPRSPPRLNARYVRYTPFNTRKEINLRDVYNLKLIKYPVSMGKQKLSPNTDMSKRCAFHETYGHPTEDCVVLRAQLEDLVRTGYLDKYIHRKREQGVIPFSIVVVMKLEILETPRMEKGET